MAVLPTIDNTLGVLFVASIVTAALYGAGMLQGWLYFRKYKGSDHWAIQAVVAFVLLCDTIQEALICMAVYRYTVSMHNDPSALATMEKALIVEVFFGGSLAFAVQSFYCWRIYIVSKSYILSGLGWLLSLASLIMVYLSTIKTLDYSSLGDLIGKQTFGIALNCVNAVADVYITIAMIYCLQAYKTHSPKTTDMINSLIVFTFNVSIPTSLCSILDVVFLTALPNTSLCMGLYLTMDRFYTNCLLVTLNSRKYIRNFGSEELETRESVVLENKNGWDATYSASALEQLDEKAKK